MTSDILEIPAPEYSIATIQAPSPTAPTQKDPLIARGLQTWQYIGILALAFSSILVVRVFSRRVEYALIFAAFLSVILIVLFFTV